MTNPAFDKWLHSALTSKVGIAFTDQLFTVRDLRHGRHGWHRYSDDKRHYVLITDDSGLHLGEEVDNPAAAIWLVGVYSHDGKDFSICEQVAGLDAAIARAMEMLNTFTSGAVKARRAEVDKPLEPVRRKRLAQILYSVVTVADGNRRARIGKLQRD